MFHASQSRKDAKGWDQFTANEEIFNVQSSFDETLYTTVLDLKGLTSEDFVAAKRIAAEIESEKSANLHVAEERGLKVASQDEYDEEDRYSGVIRKVPVAGAPSPPGLGGDLHQVRRPTKGERAYQQFPIENSTERAGKNTTTSIDEQLNHQSRANISDSHESTSSLSQQGDQAVGEQDADEIGATRSKHLLRDDVTATSRLNYSSQVDVRSSNDLAGAGPPNRESRAANKPEQAGEYSKSKVVEKPLDNDIPEAGERLNAPESHWSTTTKVDASRGGCNAETKQFKFNAEAAEWKPSQIAPVMGVTPYTGAVQPPSPDGQTQNRFTLTTVQQYQQGPQPGSLNPNLHPTSSGQLTYTPAYDEWGPTRSTPYGAEDDFVGYSLQYVPYPTHTHTIRQQHPQNRHLQQHHSIHSNRPCGPRNTSLNFMTNHGHPSITATSSASDPACVPDGAATHIRGMEDPPYSSNIHRNVGGNSMRRRQNSGTSNHQRRHIRSQLTMAHVNASLPPSSHPPHLT